MDREDVICFLRWLAEASVEELEVKRASFDALLVKINHRSDAASDVRFCLRKIDQELIARSEVLAVHQRN